MEFLFKKLMQRQQKLVLPAANKITEMSIKEKIQGVLIILTISVVSYVSYR